MAGIEKKKRRDGGVSARVVWRLGGTQEALAIGGTVSSFCGLEVAVLRGDTSKVVEVWEPGVEDCVTCVDVWRQCGLVRL
jgi:hypothetical protein